MGSFIVTIDGPAGSGKTTVSELLAERDGFIHINSGAIYRAIAFVLGDSVNKEKLANLKLEPKIVNGSIHIYYQGKDITDKLGEEYIGKVASSIAKLDFVRDYVNSIVRSFAKNGKFVIDGRDCGTVIFPKADVKIFLVASVEERAKRRAGQTGEPLDEVVKMIKQRDDQDVNRSIAPLVKAKDAIEIDTSDLSIKDVYSKVKQIIWRQYDHRDS